MVFNEWYGELTARQARVYKRYNVSPSDHDMLVEFRGRDPETLCDIVIVHSPNGMFDVFSACRGK